MSFLPTNTKLDINQTKKSNANSSNSLFSKISMNFSNMLGPAIICLPFVMQKSGLIPTLITLLFLCCFSTFSSLCLTETGRIVGGIKINNLKRFDYGHLIDNLISDNIFAQSSKFCVLINHLLYSIICIITLSKVFSIFIVTKFSIFSFILPNVTFNAELSRNNNNLFYEFGHSIINNEHLMVFLILFVLFLLSNFLLTFKILKKVFNFLILITALILSFLTVMYLININNFEPNKLSKSKLVPLIGNDYTYLYGTILFSFSFVSTIPGFISDEELNTSVIQKKTFQYSAFIGIIFKVIFSISFSYLIPFNGDFSMRDYILTHRKHENYLIYSFMIIALVILLFITLINGVINNIQLMYRCVKTQFNTKLNILYWMVSLFSPWILSLLLLVNGHIFLNLLNWSSIFLFGYVNFILPLLLYVEAINEVENFENNYKQSALLDFENFVCLKNQEIGLTLVIDNKTGSSSHNYDLVLSCKNSNVKLSNLGIHDILVEILGRISHSKDDDIDVDTKERVIDLLYELEGYYSLFKSYSLIFGGLLKNKRSISTLFYIIIVILFIFMFASIYCALYNFFINRTLVVNIFLQIQQ